MLSFFYLFQHLCITPCLHVIFFHCFCVALHFLFFQSWKFSQPTPWNSFKPKSGRSLPLRLKISFSTLNSVNVHVVLNFRFLYFFYVVLLRNQKWFLEVVLIFKNHFEMVAESVSNKRLSVWEVRLWQTFTLITCKKDNRLPVSVKEFQIGLKSVQMSYK